MNTLWRWLELPTNDIGPEQNMTMDQAIMESLIAGESLQTVRIYRWPHRCVTLGRYQDVEEARVTYPATSLYRRPTGGRAVVHGNDLTVTVVANENDLHQNTGKGGILSTYHTILAGVIDTLTSYGVCVSTGTQRLHKGAVDCFDSVGRCDLIDADTGVKIAGCAQLRSHGVVLQQMSLRPDERYYIDSQDFLLNLKKCLSICLKVQLWQTSATALPSEYLRSGYLSALQKEGTERGPKNSHV